MISLPSVRKGLKNLSLAGLAAAAVATVAYAATQGFPFTEDFQADNLKDPATTADWDTTAPGTLRLGFETDLTGMTLARAPLGDAGEVVTYSRDIVVGDIDGDGDLDAVVGNEGANSSGAVNSIYLNNNGAFDLAPASLGSDSRRTRGMAIGDLDRDGDLDIVAGNFQGRNVYHLNDGAGNFAAAVEVSARSGNTWRVHLADVDGDADLDVIESMSDDRNFLYVNQFMENGGTLSFSDSVAITSENFRTRSLALGDIDKDGDTDFIAGDQNVGNHIYRWFNGSFRARGEVHANTNITFALSLADVDGDGWLDLVEGNALAPTQIYLNQGVGNPGFFNAPVTLADSNASHTTVSLITRDMDRDGDIDIVEGNNGAWDDDGDLGAGETCVDPGASTPCVPQPVRLYLNNGDGTFANGIDFQPPEIQKIYGSAAGDFDGDGQLDFVTAHYATNPSGPDALASNAVYFNNGTPTANSVRQLDSMALSLEVSGGGAAIPAARLSVSKAQPAYLADVDFFLSNDGVTFVPAAPGTPVAFPNPNGSQLYWKADMLTASPNATQLAEISQISITANASPNFTDIGDINGVQGQALTPTSLSLYFSDPDGDTLAYQVTGLPAGTGVVLDSGTGVISGTPTNADANASPITLSATAFDGAAGRTGQITLNVTNVDEVPTANDDGPYAVDEGGAIESTFNVLDNDTDPDGQALNAVLVSPPAESALFELKPDGTFDYTHNGSETTTDSFTYSANDGTFSSAPATVTITINPVNDAPVITLLGDATVDVKQGDVYNDAGASASDAEDDDISADIVVGGDAVDTGTPGAYVITYDVTDSGGLAATQVTRTVNVTEDMPPVITLVGNAAVTLTVGNVYNEQGATASDPEDGDISANIVIGGDAVNTAAAGTYTVTYNVMDSFGNSAAEVTRTVTVNAAPEPPAPPKKKGGGAAGLLEVVGLLMLTGLILFRRRRARNPIA